MLICLSLFCSDGKVVSKPKILRKRGLSYQHILILVSIRVKHKRSDVQRNRFLDKFIHFIYRGLPLFIWLYLVDKTDFNIIETIDPIRLALYLSNRCVFRKASISSNFSDSNKSSFFFRSMMLNPKIASMPLAKQLSYIRKTISKGNLQGHETYSSSFT
jgi:hypothetical protein